MRNSKINFALMASALLTLSLNACAQTEPLKAEAAKTEAAKTTMSPAATAGRAKADAVCAVCHGKNGYSQMPNAPHLVGQPEIYLKEQLKAYRSGKRQNEVMAVIAKPLTDDDINILSAWYSSIEIKISEKP